MLLSSCGFSSRAVSRRPRNGAAAWSGRCPSFTTAAAAVAGLTKKPAAAAPRALRLAASRRDDAGFVEEEDMAVLRRRIDEVRAAECYWEPPAEWAAWERAWYQYGSYDANVCQLAGALQAYLLSCRPAVAVGLLAVVVLSVPAAALLVAGQLLDASRALISD
ncbi:hypothetical protein ACP70R_031256 [Stipagrostis hirtigluma subsp. patula]